jgi:hypothetical protein
MTAAAKKPKHSRKLYSYDGNPPTHSSSTSSKPSTPFNTHSSSKYAKCGVLSPLITVNKKMYKNCAVRCKLENDTIKINYSTGVQQGDNASPVLIASIMQALLDTLKMMPKPLELTSPNTSNV